MPRSIVRPKISEAQALKCCQLADWKLNTEHGSMALHITPELIEYLRSLPGTEAFDADDFMHRMEVGNAIGRAINEKYGAGQLSTEGLEEGTLLRVTHALKAQIDRDLPGPVAGRPASAR